MTQPYSLPIKTKVANLPKPYLVFFTNLIVFDKRLEVLLVEVFLLRLDGAFLTIFLMIISMTFSPKREHDESDQSEFSGRIQ